MIEILVGLATGLVVSLAAFALVDTSLHLYGQITDRLDSAQTGQVAITKIEQTLESSCVTPGSSPVQIANASLGIPVSSDATHLVVWSAPGDNATVTTQLRLHVIALSATSNGTLTDTSYPYSSTNSSGNYVFSNSPSVTTLATRVSEVGTTPVFQYYPLSSGSLSSTAFTDNPLTSSDAPATAAVQIEFTVAPSSGSVQSTQATRQAVEQDLYAFRLSSVSNSSTGSACT